MHGARLLARYPLISNQVTREQVGTILTELESVVKKDVPGAIVEFGCYIGTSSLFIRRLLDTIDADREFHVYDSFEGLPPKSLQDESPAGTQFKVGELSISKKLFVREFQKADLRLPVVHKAWFDELKSHDVPDAIAFAFLDGDFYESILSSLSLTLQRIQPGGVIVIDDYAHEALPGVAQAVREIMPPALLARLHVVHNQAVIRL